MQEKESIMAVRCDLKITSLWITVMASLVVPNSYPRDGIFNPHLTPIEESNNVQTSLVSKGRA